jgi:hypothetical protein
MTFVKADNPLIILLSVKNVMLRKNFFRIHGC